MEVAADADVADVLEVSSHISAGTPGGVNTGGSPWAAPPAAAAGAGDVAPRAAMALGLHRIAERVRDGVHRPVII